MISSQLLSRVGTKALEHLQLVGISLSVACAVGIGLGIFISKRTKFAFPVLGVTDVLWTIPSLVVLSLLLPILGIGRPPALVALFMYSLMPIVRNTYIGFTELDPGIIKAAKGMGLSERRIIRRIEFPLALPSIFSGIKTAGVINVGIATIASLIAAGGLGDLIWEGLQLMRYDLLWAGVISSSVMAISVGKFFGLVQNKLETRR